VAAAANPPYPRALIPSRDNAVYICLCNGLTDGQITHVVAAGATRPRAVYAACGCRAQCGGWTRTVVSIIRVGAASTEGAEACG
jgi:bacterioferritin-associated ferredoxin